MDWICGFVRTCILYMQRWLGYNLIQLLLTDSFSGIVVSVRNNVVSDATCLDVMDILQ